MPQFVKGRSGNPGGRPKDAPAKLDLLAEIRRQLSSVDPESRQSKGSELIRALIEASCGGDVRACQEVLSRVHGKVEPKMAVAKWSDYLARREQAAADQESERDWLTLVITAARVQLEHNRPELTVSEVDAFLAEFRSAIAAETAGRTLADELRSRLWGTPPVADERVIEIFTGLCQTDQVEPSPPPRCGLVELPGPEPDRPPMIRPRPTPPPEPEPELPPEPVRPAHLDPRYVQHGDLWFSIPEQEP